MLVNRWRDRAFLARYTHTSILDILGRDPLREPLSSVERAILGRVIQEHVSDERKPLASLGLTVPEEP